MGLFGIAALAIGVAACVLSTLGIIIFPQWTLLLTVLTTATPICLGAYLLARSCEFFKPSSQPLAKPLNVEPLSLPDPASASSEIFPAFRAPPSPVAQQSSTQPSAPLAKALHFQ